MHHRWTELFCDILGCLCLFCVLWVGLLVTYGFTSGLSPLQAEPLNGARARQISYFLTED